MARHMAIRWTALAGLLLASATRAGAHGMPAPSVATLTRNAAHVFRGHCVSADVEDADVGGVRLRVTRYTFTVGERLKGRGGAVATFRQVGTPEGGPRDLGTLVGLPRFVPGTEYVLFLLPEGRAGLTSPAGASAGAFLVHDGSVARVGDPAATATTTYEALRRTVLAESHR